MMLADWLKEPEDWLVDDHQEEIRELISGGHYWKYDVPSQVELYEALNELSPCYVDDGVPGVGYPLHDAGWLCAAQQRFVELYAEMNSESQLVANG